MQPTGLDRGTNGGLRVATGIEAILSLKGPRDPAGTSGAYLRVLTRSVTTLPLSHRVT